MSNIIAIIPAKSKSRRLPKKNILKLKNKELFLYSVDFAKNCHLINKIFVSSDSDKILSIAACNNVKTLKRGLKLCGDNTTNFDVLLHSYEKLKKIGDEPEIIVLIQPTTPFRYSNELNIMIEKFTEDVFADSLITVKESKRVRGVISDKYWIPDLNNKNNLQSSKTYYEATGHIIILRPKQTLKENSLLGKNIIPYNLPINWPDIDIDTKEDWEMAKSFIFNKREAIK